MDGTIVAENNAVRACAAYVDRDDVESSTIFRQSGPLRSVPMRAGLNADEQVLNSQGATEQSLLAHVAKDGLDIEAVCAGEPVGPGIGSERAPLFLPGRAEPGQRHGPAAANPPVGQRL